MAPCVSAQSHRPSSSVPRVWGLACLPQPITGYLKPIAAQKSNSLPFVPVWRPVLPTLSKIPNRVRTTTSKRSSSEASPPTTTTTPIADCPFFAVAYRQLHRRRLCPPSRLPVSRSRRLVCCFFPQIASDWKSTPHHSTSHNPHIHNAAASLLPVSVADRQTRRQGLAGILGHSPESSGGRAHNW